MAAIIPIGAATIMAIIEEVIVPVMSGKIPNSGFWLNGFKTVPVKKSQMGTILKNSIVSVESVTTIPIVVTIEMAVTKNSKKGTDFSVKFDIFFVVLFWAINSLTFTVLLLSVVIVYDPL